MGEIDDSYNERLELLENEFFEELKKGKTREEVLKKYHEKLEKTVSTFEKTYAKQLEKERELTRKNKTKKTKPETYEHLTIEHVDFQHSSWERMLAQWNIIRFRIGRTIRTTTSKIIPITILYFYYKTKLSLKLTLKTIIESTSNALTYLEKKTILLITTISTGIITLSKQALQALLRLGQSVMNLISKKKEEKKEEQKKEGEEKHDEQKSQD